MAPPCRSASGYHQKEEGARAASRGAWEEETGGGLIRLGGSESRTVEMDLRERCLPLLATAGNSKARGGGRKRSNTLKL